MKLGLVVNEGRAAACEFAERLQNAAARHGLVVGSAADPDCDVIVAVGGDGTVLDAARQAYHARRPVLGFNLGTIGFLAEVEPKDLEPALARLADGDYRVEPRLTLCATLEDGSRQVGLNDVVVEKIESQRLVVLDVEVDGENFLTHRADGIVIATSTGSTAYAFSAGGPLVDPALDTLLFTPVAPHSLFARTLVLPPDVMIRVRVAADRPVRVSVDGFEIGEASEGDVVTITRGEHPIGFVRYDTEGFAARVTRKFGLT
ncbi:MAG: NAD(+)/NADH kinase [Acidimicrobiia bacterium]|nr:NAD(+)/NADH kinase [Acidimicrobiia bacterium]MDH4307652.1 NAD(+)/NADH kinase [Acidimicrobiia bacterium]